MIESYTPSQELAGSEPITHTNKVIASGETLKRLQPLAMVTATGELKAWSPGASDGTEKAVYLSAFDLTTTAATSKKVVKGGHFNEFAIVWPDGVTAVQKASAFVGTPISFEALA